jgi:peptidoglycan/LPS O-acetylase OafA/YrhL
MPVHLSQMLYAARWLGMLLVLGVHATGAFINFYDPMRHDISYFAKAWRFLISYPFGRQAVIGFFVMSGFLVGGQVLARLDSERPFLRDYFIHRIVRIYMVVMPATALTFIFDALGRNMFPDSHGAYANFDSNYELRYLIGNLLNLQGILTKHYGSNGPLWSVAYEFWYYILFPLLLAPMIVTLGQRRALTCAFLSVFAVFAITMRQIWFPFGLFLWVLGAGVSLLHRPFVSLPRKAFLQFLFVGLLLGSVINIDMIKAHPWTQYLSDTITALAFANLILTINFAKNMHWRFLDWQGHKTLADFSFTLYAIHNPTLMLLRAITTAVMGPGWSVGFASREQWAALALAMSLTIALAYAMSRYTEGKVGVMRRYVKSAILRHWPDPASAITVSQR